MGKLPFAGWVVLDLPHVVLVTKSPLLDKRVVIYTAGGFARDPIHFMIRMINPFRTTV